MSALVDKCREKRRGEFPFHYRKESYGKKRQKRYRSPPETDSLGSGFQSGLTIGGRSSPA